MNVEGQSVVLPPANGLKYAISQFNLYTGGSLNGASTGGAPSAYAPANTTLYVFQDDNSEVVNNPNGGTYTGPPTGLSPSLAPGSAGMATEATLVGYSETVGTSDATAYLFTKTGPNSLVLTTGNTYFFYVGYASTIPQLNFDVTIANFTGSNFTPYSNGSDTGDQRYRAPSTTSPSPSTPDFGGPTNSMTLFQLDGNVVPEPSRVVGILGIGMMGAIGLCFGIARKRKPTIC